MSNDERAAPQANRPWTEQSEYGGTGAETGPVGAAHKSAASQGGSKRLSPLSHESPGAGLASAADQSRLTAADMENNAVGQELRSTTANPVSDSHTPAPAAPDPVAEVKAFGELPTDQGGREVTFTVNPMEKGVWSFEPSFDISFNVSHYPGRLHRFMQRWLLGIYWKRA